MVVTKTLANSQTVTTSKQCFLRLLNRLVEHLFSLTLQDVYTLIHHDIIPLGFNFLASAFSNDDYNVVPDITVEFFCYLGKFKKMIIRRLMSQS